MPLITLTTDYGLQDAYVASFKAGLYQQLGTPIVVDIAHLIDPFHMGQAAYVVRSVYPNFPQGSIHFIGVDFNKTPEQDLLAAELNEHFFVCADNGFLSLLEPELKPNQCVKLTIAQKSVQQMGIEAVAHIARGGALSLIGTQVARLKQRTQHAPRINPQKTEIQGHVLHIDRFGNVITNISKQLFTQTAQQRKFVIHARNHRFDSVYDHYHDAIRFDVPQEKREEAGKKLALFNQQEHLELAIYKGNPNYGGGASTLFGLAYLDPIRVAFINEP